MGKLVRACARVTVTVEVDVPSTWGAECPLDQVYRQAAEEAMHALRVGLAIDGLVVKGYVKGVARVVGEPKVVSVLTEEVR